MKTLYYNYDLKNKRIKENHFKTESTIKARKYSFISPLKQKIIDQFHYRLFKLNDKNKLLNNNNYYHHINIKDLFSNIKVKNYSNNSIKNINIINPNFMKKYKKYFNNYTENDSNFLNSKYITSIGNLKRTINIPNRDYYSSKKGLLSLKKFENTTNKKVNICLIPIYYSNKNKEYKLQKKKRLLYNNEYNDKGELYKNNNDFDILSETYYKNSFKKGLLKKKQYLFNKRMKTHSIDSKPEENDMKPKIRFINLKKDLLEENLKINRMFADFNREIAEKEKSLKFIGKHKIKNDLIKDNNE